MERISAANLKAMVAKAPNPRSDREGPIHRAILRWLQLQFPTAAIHHSPNELNLAGSERARQIAQGKSKALGMQPGWPDLEILISGNFWTLEVKADRNKPSTKQLECRDKITSNGGRWAVVRSLKEAQDVIAGWRKLDRV